MAAATRAAEPALTEEQTAALSARKRSVSLSAGAGCGKTFVLTERFLAEVNPEDTSAAKLSEVVAITFTDAAAREMRDRIRRRALERLQNAEDVREARDWMQLLRSIDGARISTIHSFCTALLRQYAVEAGLNVTFEVLDAPAADLLRLETVDDSLRRWLIEQREEAIDLAAASSIESLRADLARLAQTRHRPVVDRWRNATCTEVVAAWQEYYDAEVIPPAVVSLQRSQPVAQLRGICDPAAVDGEGPQRKLIELAARCDQFMSASPADALSLVDDLVEAAKVRGAEEKKWHDAEDYVRFKDTCESVRKLLQNKKPRPLHLEDSLAAAVRGLALTRLVAEVLDEIDAAKARRNQLEFDDLLAKTYDLLHDPRQERVRREIADGTRLVMVDEFQDTNELQLDIVKAVCGDDWQKQGLFAVGDFKQSIYRFTGAQPLVTAELRSALSPAGRLSLTANFRSQPAILDFVNALFVKELEGFEPLRPTRPSLGADPIIEFLWTPGEADGEEDADDDAEDKQNERPSIAAAASNANGNSTEETRRCEARRIAARLKELLESPAKIVGEVVDGRPQSRRLRPGDISILFRALSNVPIYEEALREAGLDYYLVGGHAFYAQQEIYDVVNLLRAVDSLIDEISLAGVLRSPVFALQDETLFWLVRAHGTLNAAIASGAVPPQLSENEAAKFRRAAETLDRLRMEKDNLLVAELITLAFNLTGYDAVVQAEFLGRRKSANLAKLVEQARALDRTSPGDLRGYITQLSEFVASAPKEPLAASQAKGDVIQIMTIHAAKGLEFPLVVLPDLERKRNSGASAATIDERLGPLFPIPTKKRGKLSRIGMDFYRTVEKHAEDLERQRLLYVACTRAADYLILSSCVADLAAPKEDWLQLVARRFDLETGLLRAPLPPGYNSPAILVSNSPPSPAAQRDLVRGTDLSRLVEDIRANASVRDSQLLASVRPVAVDSAARRRFSFSQLSGGLQLGGEAKRDSSTADDGPESPRRASSTAVRQFGALVHAALQQIDFRQPGAVDELVRSLAPQFFPMDGEKPTAATAEMLARFLATPRAAALADARVIRRELEFLLPWRTKQSGPDVGGLCPYLHGYIDCLYQDAEGAWRLLDYKTNRVGPDEVSEIANRYELQLLAYSLACEEALGAPLAEATLVLLYPGVERQFQWTDADRRRGRTQIADAMNAFANAADDR